jgi:multiple sugar transport system substrate-binding protein
MVITGGARSAQKVPVTLAALAAVAVLAAACSSGSSGSSTGGNGTFSWRSQAGTTINIGFSAHPLADSLIKQLPEFESLTGIKVKYQQAPEADFRAKLNTQLQSGSSSFDIFMTGPATNWGYAAHKWIEDLQPYVDNPALTSSDWDFKDFYPGAVNTNRWCGKEFQCVGEGPLWAIPINEEGYAIHYRKDVLDATGTPVPQTIDELIAAAKKLNGYQIGGKTLSGFDARGINNWGPLITGYGTFMFAYGGTDIKPDGTSAVNSPQVIQATQKWAEIMQYAPKDVATFDWQQDMSYFAGGNAVFLLDADHMAATFEDPSQSQVVGKVGYALPPQGPNGRASGIWLWSLGMNAHSSQKNAAWLFIQWATSKDVMTKTITAGNINPPRASVAASSTMSDYTKNWGNYNQIWQEILAKHAKWRWNPSTQFDAEGNRWAEAVQCAFLHQKSVEQCMNDAAVDINRVLSRAKGS